MKKGKIRKVGNSLGFTLPQEFVRALDLQDGDEISISLKGEKIVLEPYDPQLLELMEAYKSELTQFKNTFKSLD